MCIFLNNLHVTQSTILEMVWISVLVQSFGSFHLPHESVVQAQNMHFQRVGIKVEEVVRELRK